jgi:hypothetical protein
VFGLFAHGYNRSEPDAALRRHCMRIYQKNAGSSAPRLDRRRQFNATEARAQELP